MVAFSTIVLTLIFVAVIYYFSRNTKKLPPGPRGLPILGNLFSVDASPHLTFREWAKKFGPIVHTKIGTKSVLILDDVKLIREAFNNPVFTGKPHIASFEEVAKGKHGILNTDGQDWGEQRRFALRNLLRDFGFGKKSMEGIIHEEVLDLLNWMKKGENTAVSVNKRFNLTVLNALWLIIAGHRYEQDDSKHNTILHQHNDSFNNEVNKRGYMLFFPELAELAKTFPKLSGWNKLANAGSQLRKVFSDAVEEHEKNPADENNPRDFIDIYKNEIKKTLDPRSSFYKDAGQKSLVNVLADLYIAGSGTTSTTLAFAILYLMTHPKVQSKMQEEIDSVIGKSRLPSLADRSNTPYCEATILEILRQSVATRRESMARDQIYLFLTSIFQRFTALEDPANPKPIIESKPGLFREPEDYTVIFKDRQ